MWRVSGCSVCFAIYKPLISIIVLYHKDEKLAFFLLYIVNNSNRNLCVAVDGSPTIVRPTFGSHVKNMLAYGRGISLNEPAFDHAQQLHVTEVRIMTKSFINMRVF